MAIIFCDGFDHYAKADITKKWDSQYLYLEGSTGGLAADKGRNGTSGWSYGRPSNYLWKAFPTGPLQSFTIGAGFNPTNGIGLDYPFATIFQFLAWGVKLCGLGVTSNHQIFVYSYDDDGDLVIHGYADEPIRTAMFQYMELQVIGISPTAGAMIAHMNGKEIINVENVRTCGDSSYTYAEAFCLGGAGIGYGGALSIAHAGQMYYDDVYVTDTSDASGAGNTGFLGDIRVEELMPDADSDYKEWTPLTGSDHYAMVDDNPCDEDTSYNEGASDGLRDTYTFPSVAPVNGNVKGVCVNFVAKKMDSGNRSLSAIGRYNSTDANGTEVDLGSEYIVHQSFMEKAPDGTAWTIAKVNDSVYGPEITR